MEDDQNGRLKKNRNLSKWKIPKMEGDQDGIQPKWKTTRMGDEQSVILIPNIAVRLQTTYQLNCNQTYQIEYYDMLRGKLRLTLMEA